MSDGPSLSSRQQHLRAIGLASVGLGLSIGAAWAISSARSTPLPLGERVAPADWPIALRLPAGWKYEIDEADRWSGQLTARPGDGSGTRLLVLHSRRFGGDPLAVADQYLSEQFRSGAAIDALDTAAVGPIAGVRMRIEVDGASGSVGVQAAAAALPTGQSVILALLSTSGSSRMHRTLRSVCESVEFVRPRLSRSVGVEAERSGLECPVPAGAWYVEECSAHEPVVAFVAEASPDGAWSATAWRTYVVAPRTLEELVVDQAMIGLLRVDLGAKPRTLTVEGRRAAFVEREERDMLDVTWAVELGQGAAAMIRARGSATAGDAIRAACRTLAEGARPAEWTDAFDVGAAAKLGGAVVQEVRRRGLRSYWRKPDATAWYAWRYYGDTIGYVRQVRDAVATTQAGEDEGDAFSGTGESEYRLSGRRAQSETSWTCDAVGEAFRMVSMHTRTAGREQELEVEVRRARDSADIQITAEGGGQKRSAKAEAGDNFMPDPLEEVVLRQFAELNAGRQMVLRETTLGARRPCAVFWRREPDGEGERRIRRQADFDGGRQVYVLDESGAIERIVQDEGIELVRTERAKLERSLRWLKAD